MIQRRPRRRATRAVSLLPLLAPVLTLAAPAFAQDLDAAAHRDDDIVVLGTGSARDAALGSDLVTRRMSPSSRSLERDLLVANGTYRLSDALELFSGISQQNNRGGFLDNFAIRGFLGTPDGGAEYYVDGFLGNRGLAPPRDPATTERIEVLKGPSGAVFGDIDPAGRVNIVSKTPRFAPAAQAGVMAGSFGTRRVEMDVTGPLSSTVAARIVVAGEESDGYRDFVGLSRRVVSPSLTWAPGADTRVTVLAEHTRFASAFDRGVPAIGGDALAIPRDRFFGEPADGEHRARNTRLQLTGEQGLGGEWRVTGGVAWRRSTLRGFSSDQSRLVGERTLWRQRRERGYEAEDLSARVELAGMVEAGGTHHAAIGAKAYTLDYLELLRRRNPTAAAPYAIDVFAPVYGGTALPLLPFTDQRETRRAVRTVPPAAAPQPDRAAQRADRRPRHVPAGRAIPADRCRRGACQLGRIVPVELRHRAPARVRPARCRLRAGTGQRVGSGRDRALARRRPGGDLVRHREARHPHQRPARSQFPGAGGCVAQPRAGAGRVAADRIAMAAGRQLRLCRCAR